MLATDFYFIFTTTEFTTCAIFLLFFFLIEGSFWHERVILLPLCCCLEIKKGLLFLNSFLFGYFIQSVSAICNCGRFTISSICNSIYRNSTFFCFKYFVQNSICAISHFMIEKLRAAELLMVIDSALFNARTKNDKLKEIWTIFVCKCKIYTEEGLMY